MEQKKISFIFIFYSILIFNKLLRPSRLLIPGAIHIIIIN